MTEDEAKKRWCAFARSANVSERPGGVTSVNRIVNSGDPDPDCYCLASRCMAWREISPLVPGDGYCGLAGHPVRFAAPHAADDC